jgi:hypothetical protein
MLDGAMTGSSALSPTSAIAFPTRPSATSCAAMEFRQLRNGVRRLLGKSSSAGTWTCWRTDFFTVEVLTWRGLVTYYVLFFLHLETRRVSLAGITRHPTEEWMTQMARNAIDEESGCLRQRRYVLHDRDAKFCAEFRDTLVTRGVKCLRLPARSPNLNAFRSGGYFRSRANAFLNSFYSVNPRCGVL